MNQWLNQDIDPICKNGNNNEISDGVNVLLDGSNNLGVWGRSQRGFGGGAPNAAAVFLVFSKN